jgi:hypothetical protein
MVVVYCIHTIFSELCNSICQKEQHGTIYGFLPFVHPYLVPDNHLSFVYIEPPGRKVTSSFSPRCCSVTDPLEERMSCPNAMKSVCQKGLYTTMRVSFHKLLSYLLMSQWAGLWGYFFKPQKSHIGTKSKNFSRLHWEKYFFSYSNIIVF